MANISDMKQRVEATEAKLSAAAQEGQRRNARLLELLDAVERNLSHKQQEISRLEEEQVRAVEEVRQLRNLLHVMLTMAETSHEHGPRLALDELEQLIDRLDAMVARLNHDSGQGDNAEASPANGADSETATETDPEAVLELNAPESKPAKKKGVANKRAGKTKRTGKTFKILGLVSWLAVAILVADKVEGEVTTEALSGALLRSQVTRHELSQELARVTADLEATQKRLDRYRQREAQSATAP